MKFPLVGWRSKYFLIAFVCPSPITYALNEDYLVFEKCVLTFSAVCLLQQKYARTPSPAYRSQQYSIWKKISLQALFIPDCASNFLFKKMVGLRVENCK